MKKTYLLTAGLLAAISYNINSQVIKLPFVGSDNKWEMVKFNYTTGKWDKAGTDLPLEKHMGKESVHLQGGTLIYTKDVDFKDGTIEVDINFPDQRNFPGVAFRMQDLDNFENFYVGAQKGGQGDATRYTPVFNLQQGWQLYYGEGYSKSFPFRFNTWHHIKIDVSGLQAAIYIDDMQTPLFTVPELKRAWQGGGIALIADEAALHFANAQYTPKPLAAPATVPVPANGTNGMITRWQVSNVVDRSLFDKQYELTPLVKKKLTWTPQSSDASGIVNFSRFSSLTATTNTMVAKVVIGSDVEQVKALSFGFSDDVTVYLNDKVLYRGADTYGTRDHQFIGTMGFFDTLFLSLRKGENELWFVVSENFGGWGVQAKFEHAENISLK